MAGPSPTPPATTTAAIHPMSSAAHKRLLKEVHQTADPASLPDSIVSLHPRSESDLHNWVAVIHPSASSGSLYAAGYFRLLICVPPAYPLEPPQIRFDVDNPAGADAGAKDPICRQIPHCNVDFKTGEICLDILKPDCWSPAWTLQTAVLAIVVLLDNQEPDSPLNVDMANLFRLDDQTAIRSVINYYVHRPV